MPEEVGIGGVPLEGELEDFDEPEEPEASDNPIPIENDMARPPSPIPEAVVNQVINNVPPQLAQPVVAADVDSGRGKRIHKESAYVQRIREGENAIAMPQGLQTVPEKETARGSGAWEVQEEDWGMAVMMDAAEDLNPTYKEAKRRSDWPKWEEAI
jgi:hypothetical protein